MKFRLGAMSIGDILDLGLKLLLRRLGTFYAIGLIFHLPLIALQILGPTRFSWDDMTMWFACAFLGVILNQFVMAAEIKVIEQEYVGNNVGVGRAIVFAFSRFVPLLLASVVFDVFMVVGFMLCIVPGLIVMCMYAFASQTVVVEGAGPFQGLDRSAKLTVGFVGRILGLVLVIVVVRFGVGFGVDWALDQVFPAVERVIDADKLQVDKTNPTNRVIQTLLSALITILITTFGTICLTLTYFDLRTRKEGFDLELAANGMSPVVRSRRREADDERDDFDDEAPRRRRRRSRYPDYDDAPRRRRNDQYDDGADEGRPHR
jgi:hypothetical protein